MGATIQDKAYHKKVNIEFAEAMYTEMVTKRYGVKMNCGHGNEYTLLRKEILDLKEKKDINLTI